MPIRRSVVSVQSSCGCTDKYFGKEDSDLTILNANDDFKLVYELLDSRYDCPVGIDLGSVDIKFEFFTYGHEDNKYIAYKNGYECQNCIVDYSNSTIKVLFKDHNLKPGLLYVGITYTYPDWDFEDKKGSLFTVEQTEVKLIN